MLDKKEKKKNLQNTCVNLKSVGCENSLAAILRLVSTWLLGKCISLSLIVKTNALKISFLCLHGYVAIYSLKSHTGPLLLAYVNFKFNICYIIIVNFKMN